MYNPEGNEDNNKEYIEILTNINLTGFTIQDSSSEDNLKLIKYFPSNYSLIVEEEFNHSNINATIYSIGTTIGNNLNNPGDIIILKNNTKIYDAIHYYSDWGADGNNNSLCLINKKWQECPPTPGKENKKSLLTYNLKINEFLPDPQGYDNANMPDGEWIELINLGNTTNLENCYIKDLANRRITITQEHTYNTTINQFLIIYLNGKYNGFLNNNGTEKFQLFDPYHNLLDEITYSSTTEGLSWSKINNTWIKTIPTPNQKNIHNETNLESKIEIEKIYLGEDEKAKFGDNLRVKIKIFKGDTDKYSISAWIEDNQEKISKRTKFNIEEKYQEQTFTIPIQIFPNCDKKFEDNHYTLKVEGLDITKQETIKIEDITKNLCGEIKCESKDISINTCSEKNINTSNSTTNQLIYESKNKKTERMAIYFFCLILIFVIIQFMVEKWKK
tara:strand:+ start:720 stop:2054 length:1335 start_codon:yes stop_codon:yes gene_type:complete